MELARGAADAWVAAEKVPGVIRDSMVRDQVARTGMVTLFDAPSLGLDLTVSCVWGVAPREYLH